MNTANLIFFIICCLAICSSLFFWFKNKKKDNKEVAGPYTRSEWILFGAVMTIALAARLWKFGVIPGGMNQDGAMAAVDAKALATYATDHYGMFMPVHLTAWGYGQMSSLLSYCMVPFIKLFGLSAVTARLPILIASMCGLAALYFIARNLFGVRAAQITLIFASFNPWHFIQSRWALDCNMFPHMFLLGMLFLLMGLGEKRRYAYISMLFFALCMYSYGISFYTVPVFLIVMCVYILVKKILKWSDVLICAGIYIFISWPIYLTMAVNTYKWETIETPFFTIPFFPDSIRSRDILFFSEQKLEQLQINIDSLTQVFTEGDHLLWNCIDGFGAINICFIPFLFLGIYYLIHLFRTEKDARKKTGYLSILCFFGIGLLAGIITSRVNINRVNIIFYASILLIAIGIYFVYRNRKALAYLIAPVYLILSILLLDKYFTTYAEEISSIFFEDFIQAVQYVKREPNCIFYVITPDIQYKGSWNVSEILTLYALDIDAEYYQGIAVNMDDLNYSETFYYSDAASFGIYPSIPVAYVVMADEADLFPEEDYNIKQFGKYCAVVPSSLP